MSVKKFKFVSPGVFVNEIDNSQLPSTPVPVGPVIIGRTRRGPGFQPVRVTGFSDFIEIFGNPVPGPTGGDVWRENTLQAPTYAAYAAQAWLKNNSPCTIVRVLGDQSPNNDGSTDGNKAGYTVGGVNTAAASSGGAYGLFLFNSSSNDTSGATAVSCIDTAGYVTSNANASFTISIPTSAGGLGGTAVTILLDEDQAAGHAVTAANQISIGTHDGSESDALAAGYIIDALNAVTNSRIVYASEGNGEAADDLGVTAALTADSTTKITLTMDTVGVAGNITSALASTAGLNIIDVTAFTGAGALDDKPGSQAGCLAATWYFTDGGIQLSGATARDGFDMTANGFAKSGSSIIYPSVGAGTQFTALVKDTATNNIEKTVFNFSPTSDKFIRKVFNTNPTLTNSSIVTPSDGGGSAAVKPYWLANTYERFVADTVTGSAAGSIYGVILPMYQSTQAGSDFQFSSRAAQTGWFISQDLRNTAAGSTPVDGVIAENQLTPAFDPTNSSVVTKLFKFHTLVSGEWEQRNLKISIQDIKASTNNEDSYGKFTVVIRKIEDSDNAVQVIERFSNCTLNPNSLDYVARKIGDNYSVYDTTKRRLVEYGNYANNSKFIRIEINPSVDAGMSDPEFLPFGVHGPVRFKGFALASDGEGDQAAGTKLTADIYALPMTDGASPITDRMVQLGSTGFQGPGVAGNYKEIIAGTGQLTASIEFPKFALRASASAGNLSDPTEAYFGVDVSQNGASTTFDKSNYDLVRPLPAGIANFATQTTGPETEFSFVFTLDDVSGTEGGQFSYQSGSRANGVSLTARSGSYKDILTAGHDRFTTVFNGGFDGFDITEREPLNARKALVSTATEENSYAFYSVKKAMDIVADPEFVEFNIATAPGITNEGLTSHLVNICEDRADSLAIIDPRGGYLPSSENADNEQTRIESIDNVVNNMRDRNMNSSYGCTYFPWVRIRDTIQGAALWAPPSIVALGVMGSSEKKTEPWFAPAGFNRGGLTEGAAGLPVVAVRTKLTAADRDKLYDANINPIASFPAEGVVVFGQKTLQITPSALDRINVRRLMIYVKREISKIAAGILFDQNVQATWTRFLNRVNPFLANVMAGQGLTEFKVILDETTTTPDLIDRNILYAKIFLKPARAIEFIAIDFNITRTGAAFQD